MQPYKHKSWKPYKTCLKGDLNKPSKANQAQVGQVCLSEPKWAYMNQNGSR